MEQLRVIGTEDDALVLATESGERYTLAIDDVLRSHVRRPRRDHTDEVQAAKPSPREIQSHIRAGLAADEVAQLLGVRIEDVVRYERPVLAEREHVVDQALAVPVLLAGDLEHEGLPTFGTAIRAKLEEAGAAGERWTSWKEPTGWIVKLEFTAADVDRDARWSFEPKRGVLAPLNNEATQLSKQGPLPEGLIPRLRALETPSGIKDETRFDSDAFGPRRLPDPEPAAASTAQDAAIKRAPNEPAPSAETADLLEALRRRRGQREPLPGGEAAAERTSAPVALFDALEPGYDEVDQPSEPEPVPETTPAGEGLRRRGRTAMPSWDEIVFGARTEGQD
jgi:hypothetical protein